uniref:Uncharacterized protein n=1 Tax=Arundo donax TaxID=35708 RepID=A0A0A9AA50_ARUDO
MVIRLVTCVNAVYDRC